MTDPQRVVSINEGRVMVVTDLHGNGALYRKYRERFLALKRGGMADTLVFAGDLVHNSDPSIPDESIEIILDLFSLKESLGDHLVVLLGNHEFPHLYSIGIQKGNTVYTPDFEWGMGAHRDEIITFFDALPFFIRTRGGVAISHTGASPHLSSPPDRQTLLHYSHEAVWDAARNALPIDLRPSFRLAFEKLNRTPYAPMAKKMTAASGPEDPRFDDFLLGTIAQTLPEFSILWDTLFNKNEYEYGEARYEQFLSDTLSALSEAYEPQRVLVSGHIAVSNGHRIVAKRQLRMASGVHAHPFESARYLVFDAGELVHSPQELLSGIHNILD